MKQLRNIFAIIQLVTQGDIHEHLPIDWDSASDSWHMATLGADTVAEQLGHTEAHQRLHAMALRIDQVLTKRETIDDLGDDYSDDATCQLIA